MDFSLQLKKLRAELCLTQVQASSLFVELPLRTWEDWESGRRIPKPYVAALILDKLNSIKKEGAE